MNVYRVSTHRLIKYLLHSSVLQPLSAPKVRFTAPRGNHYFKPTTFRNRYQIRLNEKVPRR